MVFHTNQTFPLLKAKFIRFFIHKYESKYPGIGFASESDIRREKNGLPTRQAETFRVIASAMASRFYCRRYVAADEAVFCKACTPMITATSS